MFFDLNVPVHNSSQSSSQSSSKKNKGKVQQSTDVSYSPAQIAVFDARVDLLVHLGYTVIAFNQTVHSVVNPKTHVNTLESLVSQLKPHRGVVLLKRLTIILDQDSEKGFGLTPANAALFKLYDLIALLPTTQPTFSLACLTHSQPSALTAHIISLPLTLRLDFRLKHTLVRTALKHGVVFEINYVGALGGEHDAVLIEAGAAESGAPAKRNWWATAKEVVRVTKGKGVLVSGGVVAEADLRAPRDVGNLITLLGLAQDVSHSASTCVPKSLVLRAQTRQTFRAVFSEPVLVIPVDAAPAPAPAPPDSNPNPNDNQKKRPREEELEDGAVPPTQTQTQKGHEDVASASGESSARKKRRKKNNNNQEGR